MAGRLIRIAKKNQENVAHKLGGPLDVPSLQPWVSPHASANKTPWFAHVLDAGPFSVAAPRHDLVHLPCSIRTRSATVTQSNRETLLSQGTVSPRATMFSVDLRYVTVSIVLTPSKLFVLDFDPAHGQNEGCSAPQRVQLLV